jgi:hypothetical protein
MSKNENPASGGTLDGANSEIAGRDDGIDTTANINIQMAATASEADSRQTPEWKAHIQKLLEDGRQAKEAALLAITIDQMQKGWTDRGIKRQVADNRIYKRDDTRLQALIDEARKQCGVPDPESPNPFAMPITVEHYENFGSTARKVWIIKNVIAAEETSSWIGPPGSGKSALITDLALHIASGTDWRGYPSKEQCGVVYFALERGDLVKRRVIAHAARTVGFPTNLRFSIVRQVIDLLKPACVDQLVEAIKEAAEHHGRLIGFIVIDTYAKGIAASGGDENSARDQNMTLANLRRVQEATGVHIAIVGHTGKDEGKGARGSNAHAGDVDLMVQFSGDKDQRVATIIKNNDGAEGLLTRYKLEVAVIGKDEDGDDITTAIIATDTLDSDKEISRAKLNKTQRKAMEMLERAIVDDGRDAPISSEYPKGIGKVVTAEAWKACCIKGGLFTGDSKNIGQGFRRAVADLDAARRIGQWDGNVWIAYE